MISSISDIQHAFFINLERRPDRKDHVINQLHSIGIECAERFNAVQMANGAVGCSISHLKLLEMAKANNWDHILIVEDDIEFTNPSLFVSQFNHFLSNHGLHFDVALLAGNNMPPYRGIDSTCVQVSRCQTTTGYLVRQHYYDALIHNYRISISLLLKEPHNHPLYAIDKYWFRLQEIDKWYLIVPLTVTQRADYSDIEKRPTNYRNVMLDLDKRAFIKRMI